MDGPQAGLSTTTGGDGAFSLTGTFDDSNHFRATKDGHVGATFPLPPRCEPCNPDWWIHFSLEALAPHADISGNYSLTLVADAAACPDLPNEVRTRTYGATVALDSKPDLPANSRFTVTVIGSPFLAGYDSFAIGVAGDYLAGDFGHGYPSLVELIAPNKYLAFDGAATASVATTGASTISGSLEGMIEYCELKSAIGSSYSCSPDQASARAQCVSKRHQFTLTRH